MDATLPSKCYMDDSLRANRFYLHYCFARLHGAPTLFFSFSLPIYGHSVHYLTRRHLRFLIYHRFYKCTVQYT